MTTLPVSSSPPVSPQYRLEDAVTITELVSNWTAALRDADLSEATIRYYTVDVEPFLVWLHTQTGDYRPSYTDAARYRDSLQGHKGAASINRALTAIVRYIRWAIPLQLATPTGTVKAIRMVRPIRPPLTRQEGMRLLRTLERYASLRDRAMVLLLLGCGLRASEVSSLAVRDVAVTPQRVEVSVTGKGRVHRIARGGPTTRQAVLDRIRELEDAANGIYTESPRRADSTIIRLLDHALDSASEFALDGATPVIGLAPRSIANTVSAYGKLANIDHIHPHMLRRTYAQSRRAAGASLEVVARDLGHQSIDTTAIYTTPVGDDWDVIEWRYL